MPHGRGSFSPARLIDVIRGRLIDTRDQAGPFKYAALTHCWGPSMPEAGMTKSETLLSHMETIQLSELPTSFKDALIITKRLGIPYIWIDSLCIVQDSTEDWEAESAQMGLIYSYAWCTIAASSAKSCHDGIPLTRNFEASAPCNFILDHDQGYRMQVGISRPPQTWDKFYRSNPLNQRGWTFQERELSPRMLHFSADQIWWECRTLRIQEGLVLDNDDIKEPPSRDQLVDDVKIYDDSRLERQDVEDTILYVTPAVSQAVQLRCMDNMLATSTPMLDSSIPHKIVVTEARYNTWLKAVQDYSTRAFTRITDRFPALSGLASEMQAVYGDEYVAGAWRGDLLQSLLWRRDSITSSRARLCRPLEYRAPSWSWAAIDDAVTYDLITLNRPQIDRLASTTAHIEKVNLVHIGSDPKGRLRAGFIEVRGKLKYYKPSSMSRTMAFHYDFDDGIEDAPLYLLSLFTNKIFLGSVMGCALAVIMIEEPVPVFRRVGVVSNVYSEWFDDAMDVVIPIV